MRLWLKSRYCAIRKWRITLFFFFFVCWCVFFSQTGLWLPLTKAVQFWNPLILFQLDYNSSGVKPWLAHLILFCRVLLVCSVWIVSDMGSCQVLFWFCVFPPPEPWFCRRVREERHVTLLDCSTKHNWLVHEKIEEWEGSDSTGSQRAHPSGALHHLLRLWAGGPRFYGYGDGKRCILQTVDIFKNDLLFIKD